VRRGRRGKSKGEGRECVKKKKGGEKAHCPLPSVSKKALGKKSGKAAQDAGSDGTGRGSTQGGQEVAGPTTSEKKTNQDTANGKAGGETTNRGRRHQIDDSGFQLVEGSLQETGSK